MPLVKVWNDNDYPHTEKFKGNEIKVPAHKFVTMEHEDAILFRGQYTPIITDADGQPTKQSRKMIRIQQITADEPLEQLDEFICQMCKHKAESADDLDAHSKAVHPGSNVVYPDAEQDIKARVRLRKAV